MVAELEPQIATLVSEIGKVRDFGPDEDFYEAGFSSVDSLELIMQIESDYGVSIPDERFIAARTVRALGAMVEDLKREQGS